MNQNSVFKVLALTIFVVAVTVGLAFLVFSPIQNGGRFALGLVPVVLAELLLGGMVLDSLSNDEKSARHLFGLSRIWYAWLYLGFTLVAAVLVGLGAGATLIWALHILATAAFVVLSVLGSAVADRAVASDNVHPSDSVLSGFKNAAARLVSRAQLISSPDFGTAKAALIKSQDNLRYVFVESTPASAAEDAEVGACLQALHDKLAALEADPGRIGAVAKEVEATCARLDAAVKLRTGLLARGL